jgi:type IV pilus assembly protein PilB
LAQNDEFILEILRDAGLVTRSQIEKAKPAADAGHGMVDVLVEQGVLTREDVARTVAAHSGLEFVDLSHANISPDVIAAMPADLARRYRVIPVGMGESGLVVAISDPLNFETLDSLRLLLDREVEMVCATDEQIRASLIKYYGSAEEATEQLASHLGGDIEFSDLAGAEQGEEGVEAGDAPVIKMVSMMILEAYRTRASDIHIEPLENRLRSATASTACCRK